MYLNENLSQKDLNKIKKIIKKEIKSLEEKKLEKKIKKIIEKEIKKIKKEEEEKIHEISKDMLQSFFDLMYKEKSVWQKKVKLK